MNVEVDGLEIREALECAGHAGFGAEVKRLDIGKRNLPWPEDSAKYVLHGSAAVVGGKPKLRQVGCRNKRVPQRVPEWSSRKPGSRYQAIRRMYAL